MTPRSRRWTSDHLGALASSICAVHCVLTGLAVGLLSVLGLGFLTLPLAEGAFLLSALALGGYALWHGVKRHHSWIPGAFFALGMAFLAASHLIFGHSAGGSLISALGGFALVVFHILNHRLRATCDCGHCH